MEKLSRYRNKRTKRNFGRKIKVTSRMLFFLLNWLKFLLAQAVSLNALHSYFSTLPSMLAGRRWPTVNQESEEDSQKQKK